MKKYVINLERRKDRLEKFFKNCPITPVSDFIVVKAFDGKFMKYNLNSENYTEELDWFHNSFRTNINPGERGCFISHLRVYKEMVENNIPMALIFEDDVIFDNKDSKQIYDNVVTEIPSDFDIIYLGSHKPGGGLISTLNEEYYKYITPHISKHACKIEGPHYRGTFAHIVSLKCAKYIVDYFYNLKSKNVKIYQPLDHWLLKTVFRTPLRISVLNSKPLFCWSSPASGSSDIRGRNRAKNMNQVIYE